MTFSFLKSLVAVMVIRKQPLSKPTARRYSRCKPDTVMKLLGDSVLADSPSDHLGQVHWLTLLSFSGGKRLIVFREGVSGRSILGARA